MNVEYYPNFVGEVRFVTRFVVNENGEHIVERVMQQAVPSYELIEWRDVEEINFVE